jgi:hypothetical protein
MTTRLLLLLFFVTPLSALANQEAKSNECASAVFSFQTVAMGSKNSDSRDNSVAKQFFKKNMKFEGKKLMLSNAIAWKADGKNKVRLFPTQKGLTDIRSIAKGRPDSNLSFMGTVTCACSDGGGDCKLITSAEDNSVECYGGNSTCCELGLSTGVQAAPARI